MMRRVNGSRRAENALRVLRIGRLDSTEENAGADSDAAFARVVAAPLSSRVAFPLTARLRCAARSLASIPPWLCDIAGSAGRLHLVRTMPDVVFDRLVVSRAQRREEFLQTATKSARYSSRGCSLAANRRAVAQLLAPCDLGAALRGALKIHKSTAGYLLKELDRSVEDRTVRALFLRVSSAVLATKARRNLIARLDGYQSVLSARLNALDDRAIALRALARHAAREFRAREAMLLRWGRAECALRFEERQMKWLNVLDVHQQLIAQRASIVRARAEEVDAVLQTAAKTPQARRFEWPDAFFVPIAALEGADREVAVLDSVCTALAADLHATEAALRPFALSRLAMRTPIERRAELSALLDRALAVVGDVGAAWAWPTCVAGDDLAARFKEWILDRRYPQGAAVHDWHASLKSRERELRRHRAADRLRAIELAQQIPRFARELAHLVWYDFALFSPDVLARASRATRAAPFVGGETVPESALGAAERVRKSFEEEDRWLRCLEQCCAGALYSLPIAQRLSHAPFRAETLLLDATWQRQSVWMRRLSAAQVGVASAFCRNAEAHECVDGAVAARPFSDAIAAFERLEEASSRAPGAMVHTLMVGIECAFREASANAARASAKWSADPERRIVHALGAEELLPIVVYCCCQANLTQIHRALRFMEAFGLPRSSGGEPGYYLCTLAAATQHVCEAECPHDSLTLLYELEARNEITVELPAVPRAEDDADAASALEQLGRDIGRESIVVNGASLSTDVLAAFRAEVADRIFDDDVCASAEPPPSASWRDAVLARVLLACSRTESGGASYEWVSRFLPLLGDHGYVLCSTTSDVPITIQSTWSEEHEEGEGGEEAAAAGDGDSGGAGGATKAARACGASTTATATVTVVSRNYYRIETVEDRKDRQIHDALPQVNCFLTETLEFASPAADAYAAGGDALTACSRVLSMSFTRQRAP